MIGFSIFKKFVSLYVCFTSWLNWQNLAKLIEIFQNLKNNLNLLEPDDEFTIDVWIEVLLTMLVSTKAVVWVFIIALSIKKGLTFSKWF